MGENDQYGNAMTKPLPTDSIKRKKNPNMREFDLIIQVISDEDKISQLFVVDKHFDQKSVSKRQLFFHQFLKRKNFCQKMKDLFFNFLMLLD